MHISCCTPPRAPQVAVVNVANAMGNLSADTEVRLGFRAAGGVGALVSRVGQNHTFIGIYGVHTVFLAG
jgi:hypothetical protein